jgi:hypothetical protein
MVSNVWIPAFAGMTDFHFKALNCYEILDFYCFVNSNRITSGFPGLLIGVRHRIKRALFSSANIATVYPSQTKPGFGLFDQFRFLQLAQ